MTTPTVFVGPTIGRDEVMSLVPHARIEPPAACGDVCRAVGKGARVILLIDGFFERVPAVWHKEILFALDEGVRVYGCSSMGAIRAAELAPFGMVGIGSVYEAFGRNELDDDDVVVAHASIEHGYRPMSEARVNVHATTSAAVDHGILQAGEAAIVDRAAKQLFYPDRTYPAIVERSVAGGLHATTADALLRWVTRHRRDLKKEDAVQALTRIATLDHASPAGPSPWTFSYTTVFDELRRSVSGG